MKKNMVGQNLTKTWLGKSLIRVGQHVDEAWMMVGQLLVKSWSAFKANEVGQYLDKSWTDFHPFRVCQGYANSMPEFWSNKLLQSYSCITPRIGMQLLQFFSNTSPEIKQISLKRLSQQLPNAYPENKGCSLNKSGQNTDEIGTEICRWFVGEMWVAGFGKVSVRVRWFQGYKVGQFLGKTWVDLPLFYSAIKQVIQPLSFIAHSLIAHNKRVRDKQLDVPELFLYVVLPDQSL